MQFLGSDEAKAMRKHATTSGRAWYWCGGDLGMQLTALQPWRGDGTVLEGC